MISRKMQNRILVMDYIAIHKLTSKLFSIIFKPPLLLLPSVSIQKQMKQVDDRNY